MKKFLSFILATAIILSLIPAVFAAGEDVAAETQNLKLVYDISGVVNYFNPTQQNVATTVTEANTNGFFRYVSGEGTTIYATRSSTWMCNGFDLSHSSTAKKAVSFDIYVPVAGKYTMTGEYAKYTNGGTVEVYVEDTKVGEYDCSGGTSGNTYPHYKVDGVAVPFVISDVSFKKGWNNVKFTVPTSGKGGTVRTFELTLGDGSDYALMGIREKELTVGDTYTIENFNSSEKSYPNNPPALNNKITEGLTYVSSDANVAEVSADGKITAIGMGETKITVSDATGHSYDIAVSVDNPSATRIRYDIGGVFKNNGLTIANISTNLTEEITNGFFRFNSDIDTKDVFVAGSRGTVLSNGVDLKSGRRFSFDVYVPVAGTYIMKGYYTKYTTGGEIEVYVNNAETAVGSYNCYGTAKENPYPNEADQFTIQGISLNAGWNKIKFSAENSEKGGTIRTFELLLGNRSGNALMPYFNGKTTLEVGETALLKGFLSADATAATVEYSVVGDAVTVSADGKITAKKSGTATVTMTETAGNAAVANPYTVDIKVVAQDADLSDAFDDANASSAPIDYVAPTVNAIDAEGIIGEPVLVSGGAYRLEAPEEADERGAFLYWKKAMGLNEKIVSFDREFNYVPEGEGRNILVAVYEGDVTVASPKCYNANGQYLKGAQPTPADLPSMAGYGKAIAWEQYKDTNVYVAQYALEEPTADIDVTVSGGEGTGTYAYGDEVTCTATDANFKCWKKNGEIVSVNRTYTFRAWEDCTVEAVYQADVYYTGSTMKIFIDTFVAGDETGVMAEFLGFGNNVVEKGIMFNDTRIAMTTVGNQFSIIADASGIYKGYVIVKNGDELTLITDGFYSK